MLCVPRCVSVCVLPATGRCGARSKPCVLLCAHRHLCCCRVSRSLGSRPVTAAAVTALGAAAAAARAVVPVASPTRGCGSLQPTQAGAHEARSTCGSALQP
jgi:hypothetical protein